MLNAQYYKSTLKINRELFCAVCLFYTGVCQVNDMDGIDAVTISGWHKHNNTMEHHAKRPPTAHGHSPHPVKGRCGAFCPMPAVTPYTLLQESPHVWLIFGSWRSFHDLFHFINHSSSSHLSFSRSLSFLLSVSPGQEGDTCLRSADCSEGLCCARHFWSRICKPVLTEGQVCTRHRRKGAHGLELFQRCDCGDGLACRPEKGERDHNVSRTAARNLHTCQRR